MENEKSINLKKGNIFTLLSKFNSQPVELH